MRSAVKRLAPVVMYILEYIQAQTGTRQGWTEFARQAVYVCYDRSPALGRIQRRTTRGTAHASRRVSPMPPT
jgi:hypothetical protein